MTDVETLRGLRALATTLVTRIDEALDGRTASAEDAELRRGKTTDAVLRVIAKVGPMRPGEIADRLRDAGRDVTDAAVYAACSRHVAAGNLRRLDGATYDLLVREMAGGGS